MKNRSDGRRIRNVDPMQLITCFLMKKRYDSMNLYEDTIPCEVWDNYIKEKADSGSRKERSSGSKTHYGIKPRVFVKKYLTVKPLDSVI